MKPAPIDEDAPLRRYRVTYQDDTTDSPYYALELDAEDPEHAEDLFHARADSAGCAVVEVAELP